MAEPSTPTDSIGASASPASPPRPLRSLERQDGLVVAAVYEREVGASLTRVWENVYDWEHLPWLHSQAFGSIEKLESGDWGWRARIGVGEDASAQIELELVTDEATRCYVSRTLTGPGAPSEIWTHLDPVAEDRTAIRVEFWLSPLPEATLRSVGEGYVSLYTVLWDQDEDMMQTREVALHERRSETRPSSSVRRETPRGAALELGPVEEVRARMPFVVSFGGERFRIVEVEGEMLAHAVRCPHLLGPLEATRIVDGEIECPWHGYRFDVRTGQSCEGRGLRLSKAPRVAIDAATGLVALHALDATG